MSKSKTDPQRKESFLRGSEVIGERALKAKQIPSLSPLTVRQKMNSSLMTTHRKSNIIFTSSCNNYDSSQSANILRANTRLKIASPKVQLQAIEREREEADTQMKSYTERSVLYQSYGDQSDQNSFQVGDVEQLSINNSSIEKINKHLKTSKFEFQRYLNQARQQQQIAFAACVLSYQIDKHTATSEKPFQKIKNNYRISMQSTSFNPPLAHQQTSQMQGNASSSSFGQSLGHSSSRKQLQEDQIKANQLPSSRKLVTQITLNKDQSNNINNKPPEIDAIMKQAEEEKAAEAFRKQMFDKLQNTKFYSFILQTNKWRPESRESHGAICRLSPDTWDWSTISQEGDTPFEGRLGHSLCAFKNLLILFGGEKRYNKGLRIRECYNDCRVFNISNNKWSLLRLFGDYIESRRNHSACMLGKHLILIGGVSSQGHYISDISSINMDSLKSTRLLLEEDNGEEIAFSSICSVYRQEPKNESLFSPIDKGKGIPIIHQGIYMFGGRKENGEASNRLKVLILGKRPVHWLEINPKGKLPEPRYSHTLTYYKEGNILILIGGRNEAVTTVRAETTSTLYIFSLQFLEWTKVDLKGRQFPQRYSHSVTLLDSKIVIFGGIDYQGICNSELQILELDESKVQSFIKQYAGFSQSGSSTNLIESSQDTLFKHKYPVEQIEILEEWLFYVPLNNSELKKKRRNDSQRKVIIDSKEPEDIKTVRSFLPLPHLPKKNSSTYLHAEFKI